MLLNTKKRNIMQKKGIYTLLFLLMTLLINGCQKEDLTEDVTIAGYDKIKWDMKIEDLKETLNKNYSANLYEFYNIDKNDTVFYSFNSGKFKNLNVYKWEAEYYKNQLNALKIIFEEENKLEGVFNSIFNKTFNNKKHKLPFIKVLNSAETKKPITKLTFNYQNKMLTLLIEKMN
jgi:hypothetical protein